MTRPLRGEQPVDGRYPPVKELLADLSRNALFEIGQPQREDHLESPATRLFAAQPDRLERPRILGAS